MFSLPIGEHSTLGYFISVTKELIKGLPIKQIQVVREMYLKPGTPDYKPIIGCYIQH